MKEEDQNLPTGITQEDSAFSQKSEQWWSQGKVQSRIPQKKKYFLLKIGLAAIALVVVVLIIILAISSGSKDAARDPYVMPFPETEQEQRDLNSLQQQIKALRQQLNQADPTIKDTPFPNVDMTLTIDPPPRR